MVINVIALKKADRNITMNSNCAKILKYLMKHKEVWFDKISISKEIDMNIRDVVGSLTGLQKIGLVQMQKKGDKSFYQFIPQKEKIKFKN